MPGRVAQIKIKVGDTVSANQPLVVLEAMKMENEIKSPADGVVEKIHVDVGALVETNALLISFRKPSNA